MTKKITELTEEQKQKISEYKEHFFCMATSTDPEDKDAAKKAALRLAEMGGLKNCEVRIVSTTDEGASLRDSLWASLSASIRASLRTSIRDSLWDSIRDSLSASIRASLWDSLSDSLSDSLRDSLSDSLSDSLWDSLRDSHWDSLWASSWTAFYSYAVEELGIECSAEHKEMLAIYRTIAENCSAIWIVPGAVILCEKPTSVEVVNGKLIDVKWGK